MKRVGFFSDLPHGIPGGERLSDARDQLDGATADSISRYLAGATVILPTLGTRTEDVLSASHDDIGPLAIISDGNWVWPSDLPHYVREYHVRLPAEFIDDARRRGWAPPKLGQSEIAALAYELTRAIET